MSKGPEEASWDFSKLPSLLYTVVVKSQSWDEPDWDDPKSVSAWDEFHHEDQDEPEGWREYAKQHPHIPDDSEFFLPKPKMFRSRSSAKEHLSMFTRWGVEAQIVECTPHWETIPDANARRARERTNG